MWTMLNSHANLDVTLPSPSPLSPLPTFFLPSLPISFSPIIQVILNASLVPYVGVKKTNTTITSITVFNNTSPTPSLLSFSAHVFIDATYEGDLARFAGASYTYGRESSKQYNEPDGGMQAQDVLFFVLFLSSLLFFFFCFFFFFL